MAKSAYCGAERLLYSNEVPICLKCVDDGQARDGTALKQVQQAAPAKRDQDRFFAARQGR